MSGVPLPSPSLTLTHALPRAVWAGPCRYLEFEKTKGTPEGVEHVKRKATAFVEGRAG